MNKIDKTGRMYVVWHTRPEVRAQQDGVDKVIESISCTGAEYGSGIEDIARIVRGNAIEVNDDREVNPITGSQPKSKEYQRAVNEYGQRAVYEVCVKHVGYADAEGNLLMFGVRKRRSD